MRSGRHIYGSSGSLNAVLGKKRARLVSFIVHVMGAVLLGAILLLGMGTGDLRKAQETMVEAWRPLVFSSSEVLTSVGKVGVSMQIRR